MSEKLMLKIKAILLLAALLNFPAYGLAFHIKLESKETIDRDRKSVV